MAKVEIKQPIVDEIKGYAADAKAAVLVDYRGLTVEQDTKLRKALREAGVVYKVYKNTMLVRAFEGTDFAQLDKDLEGPTAVMKLVSRHWLTSHQEILLSLNCLEACSHLLPIWHAFLIRSLKLKEMVKSRLQKQKPQNNLPTKKKIILNGGI